MLEQFKKIGSDAIAELKKVSSSNQLEQFRIKFLSRKGEIQQMLSRIGTCPEDLRTQAGQIANKIKKEVTEAFEQAKLQLQQAKPQAAETIDVTLPGIPVNIGKTHVITQTINELLEIFGRMGFSVAYGPEVEDEWHNFAALNIPQNTRQETRMIIFISTINCFCEARPQISKFALWKHKSRQSASSHPAGFIGLIPLTQRICLCSTSSKPSLSMRELQWPI